MFKIKMKSIFAKLFMLYLALIFFSFLLFGSIFFYLFHLQLYEDFEETFSLHFNLVEDHFAVIETFQWNHEETERSLKASLSHKDFNIFILNEAGELLFSPSYPISEAFLVKPEFVEEIFREGKASEGGRDDGGLSYYIGSVIDMPGIDDNNGAMVMVFHNLNHQYQQMIYRILLTFMMTISVAGLLLWFISRRITSPLQEMNQTVLKYAKGDFSQPVEVNSNDEIGQLGESVNYMARELSALEETRNNLITDVSHDLRSPLTSIKGFLVALIDGTVPDSRRDHIYLLMKEETERIIKLVNDTLDMSQLEAGEVKLDPQPFNLTKQLQMIIAKLEPQLSSKQITISIIPDDDHIHVVADRNRMEQLFINLLQNGIQFSPRDSEIRIRLVKQADTVEVNVEDEGQGISEEQLSYIWQRFYKTDKARTQKAGIGIGLSIVKSIMQLHQLEIHVDSHEGEGTTFSFQLPLSKISS